MAKDRIKVLGHWSAWADAVRQGRLIRPDGEAVWVLIHRRPDTTFDSEQWKTQKTFSRFISRVDHPAVLRLLHVANVDGAPAWIYEGFQGVSLARVLAVNEAESQVVPVRAAVEVVERVVQGMRAAISQGGGLQGVPGPLCHPGPAPQDILMDSVGSVKVSGFAFETDQVPLLIDEGYAPHLAGTPEQRAAYGLAALLVHVLGGERPGKAGSDTERQGAVIRRALIRVFARPGEAVPDPVVDLIKSGLSFEPDERPELTTIEDQLAGSIAELRTESLRSWGPSTVPGLIQKQDAGYPDPDTTRSRRHIDTADDSSSYEAPPVRASATLRPPRETKTLVANVDVAAAVKAASIDNSQDSLGSVSQTSLSTIPTSETDVHLSVGLKAAETDEQPRPVVLDIGEPDDTWEIERPEHGRMGGWPMVVGQLIAMVIATVVGWVVLQQMSQQEPMVEPPVMAQEGPAIQPEPTPMETEEAAIAPAPEPDSEPNPVAEPRMEPPVDQPPKVVAAPAVSTAPISDVSTTPAPTPQTPPARSQASPVNQPAAVSDGFSVTFRNASSSMGRMVVRCHKGGEFEGADKVVIPQAGKGPCRVEGYRGTEKIAVSAVVVGPQEFICFEGNARSCR